MPQLKYIFPRWVQVSPIQKEIKGEEWQVQLNGEEGAYKVLDFQASESNAPLAVGDEVIAASSPIKCTVRGVNYAFIQSSNIIAIV
jgi:hypothetical protein